MKIGILYKLWSVFLIWFSKIKVLKFGMLPILASDQDPYVVTGHDILQIMELIEPGDVLLRGYDKYLDGKFIPDEHGYSHGAIYVGKNEVVHAASPFVHSISIIDFCQCDRVMVLRPMYGSEDAVKKAMSLLGKPYDFNYESTDERLYCFELVANLYQNANMEQYDVSKFLGLVNRKCYLAKSIYENKFFKIVYERNELA